MPFYIDTLLARDQGRQLATGVLWESFHPQIVGSQTAPTTQHVYGVLGYLYAGDVVKGVVLRNGTAAAAANPTTARFGIAQPTSQSAATILALSGNENLAASWPLGANPHPFTTPYIVTSSGPYYACFVVNGVWGTPPTPIRGTGSANAMGPLGTNYPVNFEWAGQTDLPAVGSPVTTTAYISVGYYMGFYY